MISSLAFISISLMTNDIGHFFYRLTNHLALLIHKVDVQDFFPESYLAVFYL